MTTTAQASESRGQDACLTEPRFTDAHLTSRLVPVESLLVCFVFAGVIKAIPVVAEALPWDLTLILGGLAAFLFSLQVLALGGIERIRIAAADYWLIGLALVLTVGAFYTSAPGTYALIKIANFAGLGVLASYAFPRLVAALSDPLTVVRNCFLTILSIAGVLSLVAFLSKPGLDFLRTPGGSYLSWGYLVGGAIVAACTFLAMAKSKLQTVFLLILTVLLATALVYARGRGPLIALGGVLFASCVVYSWIPLRRRIFIVLGGLALLAVLLISMPEALRARYDRVLGDDVGSTIEGRIDAYGIAWDMFVSSPAVGKGTGSYRAYHERFDYPHNIVLEVMAENGIIGLALLVGFIGSLWVRLVRALRQSEGRDRVLIAGSGLFFLFMLIGSMFSGDLTSRTLWFSAGLAVVSVRTWRIEQDGDKYTHGEG